MTWHGRLGWSRNPSDEDRLSRRGRVVPPAPPPRTPAASWAAGDPWLLQAVRNLEELGTDYHDAAAVGLVMRLSERTLEEDLAIGRALMQGTVLPAARRERDWIRNKDSAFTLSVEGFAMVVADRLRHTLRDLIHYARPDDRRRSMLRLLVERDELEGVAILLSEVSPPERLARVLQRLDEEGWGVVDQAVDTGEPPEQLVRAASLDPDVWWVHAAGLGD